MQIKWHQKLISYFYPITISKIPSNYSPDLCLQLENNKLVLNTTNANYSFGNLHTVFQEAFRAINLQNISVNKLLILGLGTGSIIDIIENEYQKFPTITAIEIDEKIIELFNTLNNKPQSEITIINDDAFNAVKELKSGYDLIVVDLFIDMQMPSPIYNVDFLSNLSTLITPSGIVLINTMQNSEQDKLLFNEFKINALQYFTDIQTQPIMQLNNVLVLSNPRK